jgi:hypothetical protein
LPSDLHLTLSTGIVVTSLDSESDVDEPDPVSEIISPALLNRMKKHDAEQVLKRPPIECQALVLYRPIKLGLAEEASKEICDPVDRTNVIPTPVTADVVVDDDAMDVEP